MLTEAENKRYIELQRIALDAARHGDVDTLAPMLKAGLPVELRDEKGNTLLMLAAYHGHEAMVRVLLEAGAEADARNDRQQTPLAGVAFKGHLEIARLLIQFGADSGADQGGGRTPVMFAAMFGHREMVAFLENEMRGNATARVWGIRVDTLARVTGGVRRMFGSPA